jgi:hypothetical protein
VAGSGSGSRQVNRKRGFSGSALLADDGNDFHELLSSYEGMTIPPQGHMPKCLFYHMSTHPHDVMNICGHLDMRTA